MTPTSRLDIYLGPDPGISRSDYEQQHLDRRERSGASAAANVSCGMSTSDCQFGPEPLQLLMTTQGVNKRLKSVVRPDRNNAAPISEYGLAAVTELASGMWGNSSRKDMAAISASP